MDKATTLPSLDDLKIKAKALRRALHDGGTDVGHGHALELIAKTYGYRDWNTLHAAVGNRPRLSLQTGQRVSGEYLGQPFDGEVIGVVRQADERCKVTLAFDRPVDVITFEGMSNFRSRVTCVIDDEGVTAERTSDGKPHLRVRRADT